MEDWLLQHGFTFIRKDSASVFEKRNWFRTSEGSDEKTPFTLRVNVVENGAWAELCAGTYHTESEVCDSPRKALIQVFSTVFYQLNAMQRLIKFFHEQCLKI